MGFFPAKTSVTWDAIARIGSFCVSVLSSEQVAVCRNFSRRAEDKFDHFEHEISPLGHPIIIRSLAWFDCQLENSITIGDHILAVGLVRDFEYLNENSPLVFACSTYNSLVEIGDILK